MSTYEEMPLAESLKQALKALKFETPTEVQAKVIPVALEGKDLISCAETGSGKTAAYGVPLVETLLKNPKSLAVVLAPTRELAQQISEVMRQLVRASDNLRVISIVGGADMRKQLRDLKHNPQIIVATTGRLTDHLKRRSIKLTNTKFLVLDEGDRMLDMGFAPQIDDILKFMPAERQTMLFTATLPPKVKELANKYMNNPVRIQIGEVSQPVKTVKQSVIQVKTKEKNEKILDELNKREGSIIVFTRTKRRTTSLTEFLQDYGFKVDQIHGGRTQGQRNKAIASFRSGISRILCATDVAARGIDVPQVEHVINFDLPMMSEDYVHRIGRTARNGASGEAVSFVTPEEHREWLALAKEYRIQGVELVGVAPSAAGAGTRAGGRGRSYGAGRGKSSGGGRGRFGSNERSESSDRPSRPSRPSFRSNDRAASSERPNRERPNRERPSRERSESSDRTSRPSRPSFRSNDRAASGDRPSRPSFRSNDRAASSDRPNRERPSRERSESSDRPRRSGSSETPRRESRGGKPSFGGRPGGPRKFGTRKPFSEKNA